MYDIYRKIYEHLKNGEDVVQAIIYDSEGSSPRRSGAKMGVLQNGITFGTIGGGRLESEVIRGSKNVFKKGRSSIMEFDLNGYKDTDMICGGRVSVFLQYISFKDREFIDCCKKIIELNRKGIESSFIIELNCVDSNLHYGIYCHKKLVKGIFYNIENVLSNLKNIKPQISSFNYDNNFVIIDPVFVKDTVFIFGAGHVSQMISKLTSMLNFKTVIIDNRKEFANRNRFKEADEIVIVDDFKSFADKLELNSTSYVILVTRGHRDDFTVLKSIIKKPAYYIGMIGSNRKKEILFSKLRVCGCEDKYLDRVYSPIGIKINSDTPEEIAVSIAAQLILKRSEKRKK